MRFTAFSTLLFLLQNAAWAEVQTNSHFFSEQQQGLRMVVAGIKKVKDSLRGLDEPSSDELILFGVDVLTNRIIQVAFPRQVEELCEISLIDSKGRSVAKTRDGSKYGTRFLSFKNTSSRVVRHRVEQNTGPAWDLFRVADVFRVSAPGTYKLRIRFQLLKVNDHTATNAATELLRFPRMEIPIRHVP